MMRRDELKAKTAAQFVKYVEDLEAHAEIVKGGPKEVKKFVRETTANTPIYGNKHSFLLSHCVIIVVCFKVMAPVPTVINTNLFLFARAKDNNC